jgi:peroxygenase
VEAPDGTLEQNWAEQHAHQTVLQQHCQFFDMDRDGIIWPTDTFNGFRKLGFGIFLSLFSMVIIHSNFAYPTQDSWIPDPRLRIHLKNIHKDKHGSDTGTYDHEGRFIPQHFEEIFVKYGGGKDYVTAWDLVNVWSGRRVLADPIGWFAAIFECEFYFLTKRNI